MDTSDHREGHQQAVGQEETIQEETIHPDSNEDSMQSRRPPPQHGGEVRSEATVDSEQQSQGSSRVTATRRKELVIEYEEN